MPDTTRIWEALLKTKARGIPVAHFHGIKRKVPVFASSTRGSRASPACLAALRYPARLPPAISHSHQPPIAYNQSVSKLAPSGGSRTASEKLPETQVLHHPLSDLPRSLLCLGAHRSSCNAATQSHHLPDCPCLLHPPIPVACTGTVKLSRQGLAGTDAPPAGPAAAALQTNSITQVLTKNHYPNDSASPVLSVLAKISPHLGSEPSVVPPGDALEGNHSPAATSSHRVQDSAPRLPSC